MARNTEVKETAEETIPPIKTVPMIRFQDGKKADVHPDEVTNYSQAGYSVVVEDSDSSKK